MYSPFLFYWFIVWQGLEPCICHFCSKDTYFNPKMGPIWVSLLYNGQVKILCLLLKSDIHTHYSDFIDIWFDSVHIHFFVIFVISIYSPKHTYFDAQISPNWVWNPPGIAQKKLSWNNVNLLFSFLWISWYMAWQVW